MCTFRIVFLILIVDDGCVQKNAFFFFLNKLCISLIPFLCFQVASSVLPPVQHGAVVYAAGMHFFEHGCIASLFWGVRWSGVGSSGHSQESYRTSLMYLN